MTKRLANLIYKVLEGTKVDTMYGNGDVIAAGLKTLRDRVYEKRDVVESTAETTTFRDFFIHVRVQNKDVHTYRERRGRLVEIPKDWVGKVTNPQTIRKRKSKAGQGARYRSKAMR